MPANVRPATPNQALQRTAPAVTLAAPPSSPAQPPRQPPPSLSLRLRMRVVKTTYYLVILLALLLPACASNRPNGSLIYGLGDNELNFLGHRLGFRVEALG